MHGKGRTGGESENRATVERYASPASKANRVCAIASFMIPCQKRKTPWLSRSECKHWFGVAEIYICILRVRISFIRLK